MFRTGAVRADRGPDFYRPGLCEDFRLRVAVDWLGCLFSRAHGQAAGGSLHAELGRILARIKGEKYRRRDSADDLLRRVAPLAGAARYSGDAWIGHPGSD